VQILASALPGFRDLRAPLTAGYLWLLFLWIAFKPDLAARPTNEIAGAVYDLGKAVGPIWIGLAIGILAYLIGSVSQVLSPALGGVVKFGWNKTETRLDSLREKYVWIPLMPVSKPVSPLTRYLDDAIEGQARYMKLNNENISSNIDIHSFASQLIAHLAEQAEPKIARDVSFPATLLLAKESLLFTETDRLKAETQFRLAIVPPLVAITILVSLGSTLWWLICLVPILILLWQSQARILEYRNLMYGALERGLIESDSVEMFRKMAEPNLDGAT
jgi:hypothetical protein